MNKDLQGLEEGHDGDIDLELLRATLKKVLKWKTPGHDGISGFWILKIHVHL